MILSASWTNPSSLGRLLVDRVARVPARVQTKLLAAFLTIVGLLIVLGAVGLQTLSGVNEETGELIKLQRKIAAYRQVQHDTTNQLYSISSALLFNDDRMLDAALRQLGQFGYDLDRMEFVASDEAELLGQVRQDYDRFTAVVTRVVELIRADRTAEAREVQLAESSPLADRLERQTNQLVNIAEADMVVAIEATEQAYRTSRTIVICFALGSILLALGLGYIISSALIGPVKVIETRLRQIAGGDFTRRVSVVNRDELGVLAANVNQTSEELGRLYQEIETRTHELDVALQQQTATADVLQVISRATFDLPAVLDTLVASAARLCNSNHAGILLRVGDTLRPSALVGASPDDDSLSLTLAIDRTTVSGRAMVSGRVEHIPDILTDPDYDVAHMRFSNTRALMGVPLLREGKVDGAFFLGRPEPGAFTERQSELVQTFADQAVIAIENVRLFEQVQAKTRDLGEALQQQTATADVLKVISRSAFNLQTVLDTLAESAARLCEADSVDFYRSAGDELQWAANFSREAEAERDHAMIRRQPGRGSAAGRVLLEHKTVHIPDFEADPEFTAIDVVRKRGVRSILGVPLLRGDTLVGLLLVLRKTPGPFAPKQIELAETFADQAVIAMENVRLFEEVQTRTRELGRSVGELKALGEVSQAVNSTLDLKTVLRTIVATAVQLSATEAGAIYVFNKTQQTFRLRATYGMSEELIAAISEQTIRMSDAGIGEAARLRQPIQMPDLSEEASSLLHGIVLKAGFRGLLIVPLLRPDSVVGALVVRRREPGVFAPSTVELLQTFAAQSVLAIQNARMFNEIEEKSRQLEIASRHKSQFLANMSHELRTPLNSVLGFTEMLSDGLYGELPDKAKATLGRVQANGKHLLGLINDVLDLSKIEAGQLALSIDDYSVGQIVKTVVAATEPLARAKGLVLTAAIAESMPLGRGDERRLTQVLLNLAGNAVKFTDAGSVEISAQARDGHFDISVKDTGPGIAPEHQERIFEEFQQVDDSSTRQKGGTGLGLAISKRIVALHGGTIGVDSMLGAGSTFRISLPIRAVERMRAA